MSSLDLWFWRPAKGHEMRRFEVPATVMCDMWRFKELLRAQKDRTGGKTERA
jgi:hypothetical protein